MEKLMVSKAIMDKTENYKRGEQRQTLSTPELENFNSPQIKYNIPQEFLQESGNSNQPYLSDIPRENTKPVGVPTIDAIKNSKLPDEIKRLMMEHPIAQPQQPTVTISDELVEKASRLMKERGSYIPESAKSKNETKITSNFDYNVIKKMINEAVRETLKENGLLVESTEKSNEMFSFRVGKHLFEGKVTKIKKFS